MPEPIKIGWLGAALDGPGGGYDKIHRMAFDEASESGLFDRPVEHILHAENGLPNGTARNATDGFRWLVDQGCIAVAGAMSPSCAAQRSSITPLTDGPPRSICCRSDVTLERLRMARYNWQAGSFRPG